MQWRYPQLLFVQQRDSVREEGGHCTFARGPMHWPLSSFGLKTPLKGLEMAISQWKSGLSRRFRYFWALSVVSLCVFSSKIWLDIHRVLVIPREIFMFGTVLPSQPGLSAFNSGEPVLSHSFSACRTLPKRPKRSTAESSNMAREPVSRICVLLK